MCPKSFGGVIFDITLCMSHFNYVPSGDTLRRDAISSSMNAYVWCWCKTSGTLDEIPSVTMGSCTSKSLNEF